MAKNYPTTCHHHTFVNELYSATLYLMMCETLTWLCRPRTGWVLVSRLQSERTVRSLLQGMFTSPTYARRHAVVHGCRVLRALLAHDPIVGAEADAGEGDRSAVELAVAPHLPLLHQALLHDPAQDEGVMSAGGEEETASVGLARVQVAALLAHLAVSEVEEVSTTMLTLGESLFLTSFFRK